jgi:hypothetical protein
LRERGERREGTRERRCRDKDEEQQTEQKNKEQENRRGRREERDKNTDQLRREKTRQVTIVCQSEKRECVLSHTDHVTKHSLLILSST